MDEARAAEVMAESAAVLRNAGARFAYLHGRWENSASPAARAS